MSQLTDHTLARLATDVHNTHIETAILIKPNLGNLDAATVGHFDHEAAELREFMIVVNRDQARQLDAEKRIHDSLSS
jgi:hypothetical protein